MSRSRYDHFYNSQTGSGIADIGPIYRRGGQYYQSGRGLSSIFSGLLKFIQPYLIKGAKEVGKEALRSSTNILSNLNNQPFGELLKKESSKSFQNLVDKAERKINTMNSTGKGIKRRRKSSISVSPKPKRRRRTTQRKNTKPVKKRKTIKKKRPLKRKTAGVRKRRVTKRKSIFTKSDFLQKYLPQHA